MRLAMPGIEHVPQDLSYALRGLRRNPGFTLTAVLAAAIGAGAAVFSAVDRILFRPLPYRDEARLVSAGMMAPLDSNEFLLADAYFDLRRNPGPFAAVTSFQAGGIACDLTEASPLRMVCLRVEANFLDTLGVRLADGRPFSAEEDRPNGPRVADLPVAEGTHAQGDLFAELRRHGFQGAREVRLERATRLRQGEAGLQAGEDAQGAAGALARLIERFGQQDIGVGQGGHDEIGRQDAGDAGGRADRGGVARAPAGTVCKSC